MVKEEIEVVGAFQRYCTSILVTVRFGRIPYLANATNI
jgi:hypothetical protein